MFDRLFMAELWCNMLLSLFCTVRFVLGMDLFLVSRFLSLGSVSCFFLFFRFRCSLPWLSPGLLPFLLPLLFLFCSPSFSLCWFPLGLCEFFMNWQSQACFSPSMIPWFSWNDHVHPEDFSSWPSSPDPRVILPVQNSSMATSSGPSWYPANGWSDTTKTTSCSNLGQPGPTILLGQRWKSNLEILWLPESQWTTSSSTYSTLSMESKYENCRLWPLNIISLSRVLQNGCGKTSGWGYWPLEGKFTLLLWEKWTIVSLWLRSFLNFAAVALIWLK